MKRAFTDYERAISRTKRPLEERDVETQPARPQPAAEFDMTRFTTMSLDFSNYPPSRVPQYDFENHSRDTQEAVDVSHLYPEMDGSDMTFTEPDGRQLFFHPNEVGKFLPRARHVENHGRMISSYRARATVLWS